MDPYNPTEYIGSIYDSTELKGKYDYTIAKTDASGNILAHKVIGGSDIEWGTPEMILTSENNILLLGTTASEDKDVSGNTTHPRTNPNDPDTDPWIVNMTPFSAAPPQQPLLNLRTSVVQSDAQIDWQVPNENNMLHYFIERGFNNISFHRIGKINAIGNQNNLQPYQFTDSGALALNFPHFYYRIACIDSLGRLSYSNTISVNHPLEVSFTGTRQTNDMVLSWTGRFEYALDHYTLQSSMNAIDFTNIYSLSAGGAGTQVIAYTYTDANMALVDTPFLYYRLQYTDTNGAISYSTILELHHPMMSQLSGDWAAGQINLLCQTKYEQNIRLHYLQKSGNGNSFTVIDSSATLGSSDATQFYTFSAPPVDTAFLYYRIMHLDSTGTASYSNVVNLHHPLVMEANGQWNSAGISLNWTTRYESAMHYFNVQRSTDGIHFSDISTTTAIGNSNNWQSYSFTDTAIDTAYLYYRISATDSSSHNWLSNVLMLHHPMTLRFEGSRGQDNIELNWHTKYERNISQYQMQRSFDGISFSNLSNTATAGNSDQWQQYLYSDINAALIDTSYLHYRLAYTDSFGTVRYSNTISFHHPMELRFNAVWHDADVDISWTSKYQQNIQHYKIQRSFNAIGFTDIQTISTNGNNDGLLSYSHTDPHILSLNEAYQYYRLVITDSTGSVTYTDTLSLHHPLNVSLNAEWNQLNGKISWDTQFEENVQQIILQRSADAIGYNDIAFLASQGNSDAVQRYQYDDNELYLNFAPNYYYRVKMVYSNGVAHYSDTTQLIRSSNIVVLAPNPTTGRMSIQSNACKGYWVTDEQGRVLKRVVGGIQNQIDITHLSNGLYWITLLMNDNSVNTLRILKQN